MKTIRKFVLADLLANTLSNIAAGLTPEFTLEQIEAAQKNSDGLLSETSAFVNYLVLKEADLFN